MTVFICWCPGFLFTYFVRKGSRGEGPNRSNPTVQMRSPHTIMDQWLLQRSAKQPHIGLNMPYKAENRRNMRPMCSGLNWNWRENIYIYTSHRRNAHFVLISIIHVQICVKFLSLFYCVMCLLLTVTEWLTMCSAVLLQKMTIAHPPFIGPEI